MFGRGRPSQGLPREIDDQRDGELIEPSPIQHQAGVTLVIADVSNPASAPRGK
jgi:hypothetical protein